jgi:hypothetical protein
MDLYTTVHVALSLFGIGSGLLVLGAMLVGRRLGGWTELFLVTTIATNATGFGFPIQRFLPSHAIAILSLVLLALAVYALYFRRLTGRWRAVYVFTAVLALYLNVFVLVVQSFLKAPLLNALAPTQTEPPFAVTQLATFAIFLILGVLALLRFRENSQLSG